MPTTSRRDSCHIRGRFGGLFAGYSLQAIVAMDNYAMGSVPMWENAVANKAGVELAIYIVLLAVRLVVVEA
jgi:hypothetical protein